MAMHYCVEMGSHCLSVPVHADLVRKGPPSVSSLLADQIDPVVLRQVAVLAAIERLAEGLSPAVRPALLRELGRQTGCLALPDGIVVRIT